MTRDYTEIPGYHGMTQPQARYNYLHDLLEEYQGLTREDINLMESCKVWRVRGNCRYCSFSGFLGGSPEVCCNWRAEAQPDKAISILETLLHKDQAQTVRYDDGLSEEQQEKIGTIIRYYPADKQLGVAQEECAELIQAISKVLRHWNSTRLDRLDHLAEEIADVRIMCAQMVRIFGLAGKVHQYIDRKLDERLEKIREEEQAHADKN